MATSTRYPGTFSQAATAAGDWTDLANVAADDGSPASCDVSSGLSELASLTNFGFTIPDGATVEGVTVEVKRRRVDNGGSCRDSVVRIKKSGANGSNKIAVGNWPTSYVTATYGGAADLWGLTLTAAEVNDSAFGLDFRAQDGDEADTAEVDFIRVTVHFAGGSSPRMSLLGVG